MSPYSCTHCISPPLPLSLLNPTSLITHSLTILPPCRREIALNGWTLVLCERSAALLPAAPLSDDLSDSAKAPPVKAFSGPEVDDSDSDVAPSTPAVAENSAAAPVPAPAQEPAVTSFSGPADPAAAGPSTTAGTANLTAAAPVDDRWVFPEPSRLLV